MTVEELLQKILGANDNDETEFAIDGEGIAELPAAIGALANLQTLSISDNQLSKLPQEVSELTSLKELYLADNQLTEVPKEITGLKNLEVLDLSRNQISEVPPEITELGNLQWLALSGNQLKEFPAEIINLVNLQWLELRELQLTDLPGVINKLSCLQEFFLSGNKLSKLPNKISELINLSTLDLLDNNLEEFPPNIADLTNLKILDLSKNQLVELPNEIDKLVNLEELYLSGNPLKSLPTELYHLPNLKILNVDENQLSNFANNLVQLNEVEIRISMDEEIYTIPIEIISKATKPHEILEYYSQIRKGENRKLNEAKILVVGQANVGKTSLIKRLVDDTYNPERDPTTGIEIYKDWKVEVDGRTIQLNIWDFAGQVINHATHQFFLTKRSLYILLIDSTLDVEANRIDYWLEKIKILGGNSPVIIIGNKIDKRQLDINLGNLSVQYPNIRGYHFVSCETKEGLAELTEVLIEEIGKLDGINDVLPVAWFAVKEKLENMTDDYLSYERYLEICNANGVTGTENQNNLLGLLHDLGIVFNFGNSTQETTIVNPEWITKGVYDILNARELFNAKGVLNGEMLTRILDNERYPPHKQMAIVRIMQEFELCFEVEATNTFLIPDLLSEDEFNTGSWEQSLNFEYQYNVLFNNIIKRFQVKMHKSISKSTIWRSGAVLEYSIGEVRNEALIKADSAKRKITIAIRGNENTRRDFLSVIRNKFQEIHDSFPDEFKENFAEKVPIPGFVDHVVDYQHLLNLEQMGQESIIPEGLTKQFRVKELLNGIESEESRRQQREEISVSPRLC